MNSTNTINNPQLVRTTPLKLFKESINLTDEYTASVTKENITIGCKTFSHEVIAKLYRASKKAQNS